MRALLDAFDRIWTRIFSTPIHLDSALAKEPLEFRGDLARILPQILRTPVSLAQRFQVRIRRGDPWSLNMSEMSAWAPARALARAMVAKEPEILGQLEDFPPAWTAEWRRDFGEERARQLATILASRPPISIRASRARGRDAVRALIGSRTNIAVEASNAAPFGLRLDSFFRLTPLLDAEPGAFEIQDEGSQVLASFALHPELFAPLLSGEPGAAFARDGAPSLPRLPSLTVIDACAGAGGKTLAIADALAGGGRVFAYDVFDRKLLELRRRMKRAGLTNVKTQLLKDGEERALAEAHAGTADVVLIDAPCSGWGVLKRNPDVKWRQDVAAQVRLEALQARLLDAFVPLLKSGGRLVYGACTFRPAETTAQIDAFALRHPELVRAHGGFFGPSPTSDGFFMQAMVAP